MNLIGPATVSIAPLDTDFDDVGAWTTIGTADSLVINGNQCPSPPEEEQASALTAMLTSFDFATPVRMIRHLLPYPCLDTRSAIKQHLVRERISQLLAEARSRPVVHRQY